MKILNLTLILWFIICCELFPQTTHIQVESGPGISIFLDGRFEGVTNSEFGGLIIKNVTPGTHAIKAVKEGFMPQVEQIIVPAGKVKLYIVKAFTPQITISEEGKEDQQSIERKTGVLKIQSLPVSIYITVPGLIVNYNKRQDEWLARDVPAGNYNVVFKYNNISLTENLEILHNDTTHIFVNMVDRKVEYIKRPGPVGNLIIRSNPDGIVTIGGSDYGNTPLTLKNMPQGYYEVVVSAYLSNKDFGDNFKLSKEVSVDPGKTKTLNYNFYDTYKLGKISITSNQNPVAFSLINRTFDRKYSNLSTEYNSSILTGAYEINWGYTNSLSFNITETNPVNIFIPIEKQMISLAGMDQISGYQSFETYLNSNYKSLPESKRVSYMVWEYSNSTYSDGTVWGVLMNSASLVALVAAAAFLIPGDEKDVMTGEKMYHAQWGPGLACVGLYGVIKFGLAPLAFDRKSKTIKSNVAINQKARENYQNTYNSLYKEWENQLNNKNSKIVEENQRIMQYNSNLPPASVRYKK